MNRFHTLRYVKASALLAGAIGMACLSGPAVQAAGDKDVDFAKDIQPIFKASCVRCHSVDPNNARKKPAAGFRLDDKAGALKGGKAGSDIVPGNSKDSLLYQLLQGPVKGKDQDIAAMPKGKRGEPFKQLPQDKIDLIQKWIDQGAKWPE
jgi:mono/diheme cytochrome c family protein